MNKNPTVSAVELSNGSLQLGNRTLWSHMDSSINPGEFIAILGPNGTGKTTFLKVLLGQIRLSSGTIRIFGELPGKQNQSIGYIPQQKNFDRFLPIRGRDLVRLGLTGTQFGMTRNRGAIHEMVERAITLVHATAYADMPIGMLSGGEQQRLRIAQAIVGRPRLLLCDEPLLSLDVTSQGIVTSLLDTYRKESGATIIFVTHEINPVLPYVDRVLYLANGQWVIDTPARVLRTETLTKLYDSPVEVLKVHGRLLVIGGDEATQAVIAEAHHEDGTI